MEQGERGQLRRAAALGHAKKHKAPVKPLAPVAPAEKLKGQTRRWNWIGEDIPSKGLRKGVQYEAKIIREAGFKLPKLEKKARIGHAF